MGADEPLFGSFRGQILPTPGSRFRVAITGALLTGGYSVCYFLALEQGVTPGILATILGTQPILTLLFYERRFDISRLVGLIAALIGLMLIVLQSVGLERVSSAGTWFALCALICATAGAILQKGIKAVAVAGLAAAIQFKPASLRPDKPMGAATCRL